MENVSLIGLGALGIMFGHLLEQKMPEGSFRVIADRERIDRYKKEGIYCNNEACHFTFTAPEEEVPAADLLLIAVKYNGLADAIKAVRKHIGPDTIILSLLNGISSEEIIAETYGEEHLLYCVAQGMDAGKEGNQCTYKNMGMLCIGEAEKGYMSDKMKRVAEFFDVIGFPYRLDTDMMKRLWGKFMLNVGVNQTVAVYEATYEAIQREGEARDTMIAAMREVMELSKRVGVSLTKEDLSYWLKVIEPLNPVGKPSMRQDTEAKRPSEVELFSGTVLRLAKKYGVETPVNAALYERIAIMEGRTIDFR